MNEIELTPEEVETVNKLNETTIIGDFVSSTPDYSNEDVKDFTMTLRDEGFDLRPVIVRRLIKNEVEKNRMPSLVDLDYDVQLKYAVDMLRSHAMLTGTGSGS